MIASRRTYELRARVLAPQWLVVGHLRDLLSRLGLLDQIQLVRTLPADRRQATRARTVAATILPDVGDAREHGPWRTYNLVSTHGDIAVLAAGPTRQPRRALIKIAETPAAAEGLECHRSALIALQGDERLGAMRSLIPRVLDAGEANGLAYVIEQRLPGTNLERVLGRSAVGERALHAAAAAIGQLHVATAREVHVGHGMLERWVSEPARVVGEVLGKGRGRGDALSVLGRLEHHLRAALAGGPVAVSWVHGDYYPRNILAGPDGTVTGIVDWEFADPQDLPALDMATLLLTVRMWRRHQEFGQVVVDLVTNPTWTASETRMLVSAQSDVVGCSLGTEALVLLCWLRHAAAKFTRRTGYADHGLWMHANVHTVLAALAQGPTTLG
jgi:aminoglycoside phosphotransferase (APT) family kinase protein